MSKFFSPKQSVILHGVGYVADKVYPITEDVLPDVLRLMDEDKVFLYEEKPNFGRTPVAVTVPVVSPAAKLGKPVRKAVKATKEEHKVEEEPKVEEAPEL